MTDYSLRALDLGWKAWFIERELGSNPGIASEHSRPVVGGRYVLQDLVGEGHYGTVYTAIDNRLGREVAIKAVEPEELAEARLLARVRHPNVVTVHESDVDGDIGYLVLEYVRGPSLEQWCRVEGRSRLEVLRAFIEAGRGLAAVHASGLVHRDFKPKNVVVSESGRAVLIDFGLAHPVTEPIDDGRGSPKFMAPEIMTGRGSCPESDQFAFCVALWESLTGQDPFRCITPLDRMQSYVDGVVSPWRLPGRLGWVLRRGLSLRPSQRWPSMDALLRALEKCDYKRRAPRLVGSAVVVASLCVGLLPLSPWARPATAGPCDMPPEAMAVVAERVADEGRAADALAMLEAAAAQADSDTVARRVAMAADEVGLRLYADGDFDGSMAAHKIALETWHDAEESDLEMRSRQLYRAAIDARARAHN